MGKQEPAAGVSPGQPSALAHDQRAVDEGVPVLRRMLEVADAVKTTRDPAHLSLGTCQQLYLALRIALLMEADNVGRAIPILADDILVNFDSARRVGAAEALAELARRRQVILFTCHEEIVETLRAADPTLNEVEL